MNIYKNNQAEPKAQWVQKVVATIIQKNYKNYTDQSNRDEATSTVIIRSGQNTQNWP